MNEASITLIQARLWLAESSIDLTSGAAESSCTLTLVSGRSAGRVLANTTVTAWLEHCASVVGDAALGTETCPIGAGGWTEKVEWRSS